jgi:hypothetical protein
LSWQVAEVVEAIVQAVVVQAVSARISGELRLRFRAGFRSLLLLVEEELAYPGSPYLEMMARHRHLQPSHLLAVVAAVRLSPISTEGMAAAVVAVVVL